MPRPATIGLLSAGELMLGWEGIRGVTVGLGRGGMAEASDELDAEEISFGPFRLLPARKLLLRSGAEVRIGQRAFDLLLSLVGQAGDVVDKPRLLASTWPGLHVDEGNLRVQVSALRRALGDGVDGARYVASIAGRGYSFVAQVERRRRSPVPSGLPAAGTDRLPRRVSPVIGRGASIATVAEQVRRHRFVTIVGPGGIGKTTVAIAVAQALAEHFEEPPCFVDLSGLSDGEVAIDTLAASLGLAQYAGKPADTVEGFLRDRRVLILLDSCEPVVEAAARIAEDALRAGAGVHILATSREPLRAEGEWTHRLPPMESPPAGLPLTVEAAAAFPTVALFLDRAAAARDSLDLSDADMALVASICRRLDGIPLAIELAARWLAFLGLRDLAERLDDRFGLLMKGRRTALPRHQTLRATLDWSFHLLPPRQQAVLCRLAVFRGGFTAAAALAVAAHGDHAEADILEDLTELIDKSLLAVDLGGPTTFYRCLDTTRAYLLEKLDEAGARHAAALAHARHCESFLRGVREAWASAPPSAVRELAGRHLDNLRAALDWCFGPEGDVGLGMALTVAATPIWSHVMNSLAEEGSQRVLQALRFADPAADPALAMRLLAALASLLQQFGAPGEAAAWHETLTLAERLGDATHQSRAMSGLFLNALKRNCGEALDLAERFRRGADATGQDFLVGRGDRLIGYARHLMGEQATARAHLERMLRAHARPADRGNLAAFNFDDHVLGRSTLSQVLWLQGFANQALATAREAVRDAAGLDHEMSLFFAISFGAGPVGMLAGDGGAALAAYELLPSEWMKLPARKGWLDCFRALDRVRGGDLAEGLAMLRLAVAGFTPGSFGYRYPLFRAALADCLIDAGRPEEALPVLEAALVESRGRGEAWCEPELLRLQARATLAACGASAARNAEVALRESMALAQRQSALAWELRGATSLAALLRDQKRRGEARDVLAAILGRFTEGFETPDLQRADRLLAGL